VISFEAKGSFDKTIAFLESMKDASVYNELERYGQMGVTALANATPKDTSETADSWYYEVVRTKDTWSIIWGNTHVVDGRPIAVLLQYGHGTGTGGYVPGRDYINPALRPIFDQMAEEGWRVVTAA
jgi:hypothetical protein